jgi:protein-disulfide isomerase
MARKMMLLLGALILLGSQSWAAQNGPKISVGDDPSRKEGNPGLVLIEVSDFQCPYCGQGAREVLAQVEDKFVRTGKVELIFLDFPLPMHPDASKAAAAAACAGDQNKFWEMHHELFTHQDALSSEQLAGYAGKLGLDVAAFQKCISSGKTVPGIREDMRVVQNLGINGTPAYLLGRRIPGGDKVQILDMVKGLPPYEDLEKKINALLTSE